MVRGMPLFRHVHRLKGSGNMAANKEKITRRNFVGAAMAGTMGLAAASFLGGCSKPAAGDKAATSSDGSWQEEADIVVVGTGGGGYAAAVEAANAGASVLLLEKSSAVGGDSALCDGILGGWGTRLAKEQGISATADQVYEWFMAHPEWYGPKDAEIARVQADKSGETIDWLQDLGTPFAKEVGPRFGYTELPVIHQVEGLGAAMIKSLGAAAEKAGVKTLMETRASKLLTDAEGRVIGLEASQKKDTLRIKANKGVILATGGHSGSKTMLAAMNPECANILPGSNPGATGDGLALATSVGALATRAAALPLMSSLAGLDTKSIVNLNYSEHLHGLWLDANGERFFNEETPYESPLGHRAILRKHNEQGRPAVVLLPTTPELEAVLAKRPLNWVKADTAEDAAAQVGLDGAKVKATVERYNALCAAGRDDDFGRPAESLIPLTTGPFYASAIMVSTSVVTGGIKTNAQGQALRMPAVSSGEAAAEAIPGLYVAGVAADWNCAAGATVLCAMTMGRIAAQNATKNA